MVGTPRQSDNLKDRDPRSLWRLQALEDAAAALGEKLRTMARAPGDPPRDARRQAWTEALEAWRDTFGGLMEVRR